MINSSDENVCGILWMILDQSQKVSASELWYKLQQKLSSLSEIKIEKILSINTKREN